MELNKGILSKTLTIIVPGAGTELVPLTRYRPQPLLPFGSDSRIIDSTILNCRKSGLRKAFVLAPRQAHAIANHLESPGSGMNLVTLRPDASVSRRSSVDLLFQSIGLLRVEEPEYVLVLLTDHIYEMDYKKLMQLHIKNGAQITIVTNGIADVGVYVFNAEMFRRVMLIASLTDHDVIGRTAILRAADPHNICSYDFTICSGRHWGPVDTIDSYYRTQLCFPPLSDSRMGVVSSPAHIDPSAAITDSILMRGVHVGAHTRIRKAIVEENMRVPDGVVIGFNREDDRRRFIVTRGDVVVVDRTAMDRLRPAQHSILFRLSRAA